jgi:hypothetical protein
LSQAEHGWIAKWFWFQPQKINRCCWRRNSNSIRSTANGKKLPRKQLLIQVDSCRKWPNLDLINEYGPEHL